MVTEISLEVMKMFGTWQRWWLYNINVLNAPVDFEMANFILFHLEKIHKNPKSILKNIGSGHHPITQTYPEGSGRAHWSCTPRCGMMGTGRPVLPILLNQDFQAPFPLAIFSYTAESTLNSGRAHEAIHPTQESKWILSNTLYSNSGTDLFVALKLVSVSSFSSYSASSYPYSLRTSHSVFCQSTTEGKHRLTAL